MLMRVAIGQVLRDIRTASGDNLRPVSARSGVALGYLSEVERGIKEVSSELLESIAAGLGTTVPVILSRAGVLMHEHAALEAEIAGMLAAPARRG